MQQVFSLDTLKEIQEVPCLLRCQTKVCEALDEPDLPPDDDFAAVNMSFNHRQFCFSRRAH
jgi:hypothetical protein